MDLYESRFMAMLNQIQLDAELARLTLNGLQLRLLPCSHLHSLVSPGARILAHMAASDVDAALEVAILPDVDVDERRLA